MPTFLNSSKKNGEYLILNPVYTGNEKENFAEKWNKHPERASAFFKWVNQLQIDFDTNKLEAMSILDFGKFIKKTLGESVSNKALNIYAEEERKRIVNKKDKVDTKTGTLTSTGTVNVPSNHHYGQIFQK